jgi:hypothetical protein
LRRDIFVFKGTLRHSLLSEVFLSLVTQVAEGSESVPGKQIYHASICVNAGENKKAASIKPAAFSVRRIIRAREQPQELRRPYADQS